MVEVAEEDKEEGERDIEWMASLGVEEGEGGGVDVEVLRLGGWRSLWMCRR